MTDRPGDRELTGAAVAKGAAWATAEVWGLQAVQLMSFLVLARLLGPDAYGLIGIALTVNLLGEALVVEGGWIEAIVQRRDLDHRHLDAVFWAVLGLGCGMGAIAISGAPLLADLFAQPRVAPAMAVLGLALPIRSLAVVPEALLCRRLDFAPLAARSLLSVALAGAVGVALAVAGAGIWSLVAYHVVQPCAATLLVWRAVTYRPALAFPSRHLRSLTPFVGVMLTDRAVVAGDSLLPRLVIGYLFGPGPLGHYTVARKLTELAAQLLTRPVTRVGLSSFAASGERESLRARFRWSLLLGSAIAWPGFLGLAMVAPDIVELALGKGWEDAAAMLRILALAGPAWATARVCAVLLYSRGRPGMQLAANLAGLLSLAALLALGMTPTVSAMVGLIVARSYLVLPLQLVLVRRATGIDAVRDLAAIWPVVVASVVLVGAVWALQASLPADAGAAARLLGSVAVGAAAYAVALSLVARPLLAAVVSALGAARLVPSAWRAGLIPGVASPKPRPAPRAR